MHILLQLMMESWNVLLELAPWMFVGMVVAGLLHGVLPPDFIRKQLQGPTGVLKAVALGVPLPLCSCGVIPAGLGLKRDGASDGSAVAFLISTPQTGVDSILVSGAMLGWPFALFKVFSASVTGAIGGWLVDATVSPESQVEVAAGEGSEAHAIRVGAMVEHSVEVLRSIWRWLVFGVLVSALISVFVPAGGLGALAAGGGILAAMAMLAISVPLYVCATASVPIAAALVAGGMPTGAALVFLMAGPATNVATLGAIYRGFGARVLGVYLSTIVVGSIGFALTFDWVLSTEGQVVAAHGDHSTWWAIASAVGLLAFMVWFLAEDVLRWIRSLRSAEAAQGARIEVPVSGMTCGGCVKKLDGVLRRMEGADFVEVQLDPQRAVVVGSVTLEGVEKMIQSAGFESARDVR